MAEKKPDPGALKITNQFRGQTGFVYELSHEGSRLSIRIAPRQNEDDPDAWSIEASTKSAPDLAPFKAWGKTRVDALRAVAVAWEAAGREATVATFNWDDVQKALANVRAV